MEECDGVKEKFLEEEGKLSTMGLDKLKQSNLVLLFLRNKRPSWILLLDRCNQRYYLNCRSIRWKKKSSKMSNAGCGGV